MPIAPVPFDQSTFEKRCVHLTQDMVVVPTTTIWSDDIVGRAENLFRESVSLGDTAFKSLRAIGWMLRLPPRRSFNTPRPIVNLFFSGFVRRNDDDRASMEKHWGNLCLGIFSRAPNTELNKIVNCFPRTSDIDTLFLGKKWTGETSCGCACQEMFTVLAFLQLYSTLEFPGYLTQLKAGHIIVRRTEKASVIVGQPEQYLAEFTHIGKCPSNPELQNEEGNELYLKQPLEVVFALSLLLEKELEVTIPIAELMTFVVSDASFWAFCMIARYYSVKNDQYKQIAEAWREDLEESFKNMANSPRWYDYFENWALIDLKLVTEMVELNPTELRPHAKKLSDALQTVPDIGMGTMKRELAENVLLNIIH